MSVATWVPDGEWTSFEYKVLVELDLPDEYDPDSLHTWAQGHVQEIIASLGDQAVTAPLKRIIGSSPVYFVKSGLPDVLAEAVVTQARQHVLLRDAQPSLFC